MLTVTITELNVRADEHVRAANDANRYGWMQADARGARASRIRVGLGALGALVRRPSASIAGSPADRSAIVPVTSPRGAA